MEIWRRKKVCDYTGKPDSSVYADSSKGLFPKPVKIGPQASGWPADEVIAINRARIAGKSEDEIRALVADLHLKRLQAA